MAPASEPPERVSEAFERLWVCYDPMYQLSKYYRHGELDSCDGKWNDLWRALAIRRAKRENRTVDDIAAVDDARERSRNSPELAPMWKTAAPATAGKFWRKTFKENVPSEEEIRAARRAFDAENAEAA